MRRVDTAECDIGIGHRGIGAAAAITGGTWLRTGTARPDLDAFQGIDAGDRATTGADLDHLDHRDAHRQAAALHEARRAIDLEGTGLEGATIVDQADLGGGAAHVEREDRRFVAFGGNVGS